MVTTKWPKMISSYGMSSQAPQPPFWLRTIPVSEKDRLYLLYKQTGTENRSTSSGEFLEDIRGRR